MNHFLDIHTTPQKDLRAMIDQAKQMKDARQGRPKGAPDDEQPLAGRMVALIFEKPSTRTRVSARRWFCPVQKCNWVMGKRLLTRRACCRVMLI
jgi:ornithine carbamoyltransferase